MGHISCRPVLMHYGGRIFFISAVEIDEQIITSVLSNNQLRSIGAREKSL
jgi:hypothetical protein